MKAQLIIAAAALSLGATAMAKGNPSKERDILIGKMTAACKAELAKEPGLADTTDGEKIWKNLEDKEHAHVKLSKNCHAAHEKYEAKFHKDEEADEQNEHGE